MKISISVPFLGLISMKFLYFNGIFRVSYERFRSFIIPAFFFSVKRKRVKNFKVDQDINRDRKKFFKKKLKMQQNNCKIVDWSASEHCFIPGRLRPIPPPCPIYRCPEDEEYTSSEVAGIAIGTILAMMLALVGLGYCLWKIIKRRQEKEAEAMGPAFRGEMEMEMVQPTAPMIPAISRLGVMMPLIDTATSRLLPPTYAAATAAAINVVRNFTENRTGTGSESGSGTETKTKTKKENPSEA